MIHAVGHLWSWAISGQSLPIFTSKPSKNMINLPTGRKWLTRNDPWSQMAHCMDHPIRPFLITPIHVPLTFYIPPHHLKVQNHPLEPSTSTLPHKRQLCQKGPKIFTPVPKFIISAPKFTSLTPPNHPLTPYLTCPYPFPPLPSPSTPNSSPDHPQHTIWKMSGPFVVIPQFWRRDF